MYGVLLIIYFTNGLVPVDVSELSTVSSPIVTRTRNQQFRSMCTSYINKNISCLMPVYLTTYFYKLL